MNRVVFVASTYTAAPGEAVFGVPGSTVTNKQLTSNVATLTTSGAHGYNVGDSVTVSGVDATFNGTYTVTAAPSAQSFSYAKTAANVTSAFAAGSVTRSGSFAVNLPAASWGLLPILIKNVGTFNTVTVTRSGAALINGATTYVLSIGQAVTLVPDGANWQVTSTVAATVSVPGAPTIGTATAGVSSVSVAFTPPAFNGGSTITSYTVTTSTGQTGTGTSSPIVVTGCPAGTAATATVHAANIIGNSAESSASNSYTPSAVPSAPGAPTIGTAVAGDTQATANWTAPASDGGSAITGYDAKTYDSAGTLLFTDTVGVVVTYVQTGLTNGTAYKFTVDAINAIGAGALSGFSNTVTPAGFSPANYANLVHWLEADAVGGSPADGDALATWTDQSVSAKNATQATAGKKPIYKASVAAFNNQPVVRFASASAQIMDTASPVSVLTTGYTHIVICSASDATAIHAVFFNGDRASTGRGLYTSSGDGPGNLGKVSILIGGTVWQDTSVASPSTPTIFMFNRIVGDTHLYINGVEATVAAPAGGNPAPTTLTSIGGDGTYFHEGDVALELTYDAVRTTAELNALGTFYAAKYGFTWTNIP